MIVLSIIYREKKAAEEAIVLIIKNKLAISIQLDEEKHFVDGLNVLEDSILTYKVSFMTKALLYEEIENLIYKYSKKEDVVIYSIPISQMNVEHSKRLRQELKGV